MQTVTISVVGHHGTSVEAAEEIATSGFKLSRNRYDWLGDGVYFFQESHHRARQWAVRAHHSGWAVISADIDLTDCMDLMQPGWEGLLADAYDGVVEAQRAAGLRLPKQAGLAHGMDRLVINYLVGTLAQAGQVIRSVRCPFREGRPPFAGSELYSESHVQIAVRDLTVIDITSVTTGELLP